MSVIDGGYWYYLHVEDYKININKFYTAIYHHYNILETSFLI